MHHKQNYALKNVPAPCHAERPRSTRTIRATSGTQKHPRAMSCWVKRSIQGHPFSAGRAWMLRCRSAWHVRKRFSWHDMAQGSFFNTMSERIAW